ncbi:DUF771 domain-containing protein [Latilactobacillus curvatus]|uniref:DUF771 domain-containing protein n=1 Tax=Latilactobacillus curvatus TaxID=28038 RepID=A0A385AEW3_LATCU|nr:DUF771 domain-containing protein [Latilactobacillus curvatus]WEU69655.1 hypothetical protein [Latilactobacillus phage TMW 1.1381 P1]AWV73289.1 DUF771 domain-containing protein [Latilactobacillus curvatus]AXN36215.1 DUF771 domain-containing protein [Latilactobacillus curvatus]MCT3525918.1 DUF771 domain-containing protein [Latilactobacillus curvatus]MDT7017028.1 DUF771 domain-containing protein [Latilactobacillus curvatus]
MERTKVVIPQFSIELPAGIELISTEKREQLESDRQVIWDLNKAVEMTGYTKADLKKILTEFKKRLDMDNGGCVYYPYHGGKYSMESLGFTQFIRNNFAEITGFLKG